MSAAPTIRVEQLSVDYHHGKSWHRAVKDVSFEIGAGEILGLAGESGSGKSTVAYTLLGEKRAGSRIFSGRVLFAGQDLLTLPESSLRRLRGKGISFVPQNPTGSLTPTLSCGRQVAEVLRVHGQARGGAAKAAVLQLFEQVGLTDPLGAYAKYPHQLSGGQQQRVVIAMALAGRPSLIVLDEPTTGLDVTTQWRILNLLADIRARSGTAMLYVSHDLGALSQICDRIAVMYRGELVEGAPTASLFAQPLQAYTRGLLAAMPSLDRPPAGAPATREAPSCEILLTVDDLNVTYRRSGLFRRASQDFPAVRDLSFSIRRGETFALVGESGSGKSTVVRAVEGLVPVRSGRILFESKDIAVPVARRQSWAKRRLQIVFQNPDASLNPRHRIRSIIGRPLTLFHSLPQDQRRDRIIELLRATRLDAQFLDRLPRQLSGGERQRVAISRALAAEPDLLLCDEILSALDVSVQDSVLALMRQLQQERGLTYLFISHDLSVVRWLAHSVGVLFQGEMCEVGPVERVFDAPYHPYTELLLLAVPRLGRTRTQTAPINRPPEGLRLVGCAFAGRCPRYLGEPCDRVTPPLQTLADGHQIRCHIPVAELAVQQQELAASLRPTSSKDAFQQTGSRDATGLAHATS